ncbi:MAG: 2-hydroxychromene-2-carboxylate isomerase [Pseudomonadota bacterium]
MATLEYFFDYVSPWSYVAHHAMKGVVARTGATVSVRPMFLGGVMQATGNRPPGMVAAKAKYMGADLARACKRYGITMHMNPNFPMNTRGLTRATLGLMDDLATRDRFIEAVFRLCWNDPRGIDPADPSQLGPALAEAGFDPEQILALATDDANKAALRANTDEAVERGAFGAPTFFVGDEMFFGHDRLDYVEEALMALAEA